MKQKKAMFQNGEVQKEMQEEADTSEECEEKKHGRKKMPQYRYV